MVLIDSIYAMNKKTALSGGLAGLLAVSTIGGCTGNTGRDMSMAGSGLSAVSKLADQPTLGYVGTGISILGKIIKLADQNSPDNQRRPEKYHLQDPPEHIDDAVFAFVNDGPLSFDADLSGFNIVEGSVSKDENIWLGARAVNKSGGGHLTYVYRDGTLISSGYHTIGLDHQSPRESDVFFLVRPLDIEPLEPGNYKLEFLTIRNKPSFIYTGVIKDVYAEAEFKVVE